MYKKLRNFIERKNHRLNETHEVVTNSNYEAKSPKVNLGKIQATLNNQLDHVEDLWNIEFQVFSQFGDDGIIQYLVNKLPFRNRTFIEFGVENYKEANTRFLLINNSWSGMVMDGSEANVRQIRSSRIYSFYDLRAVQSFITPANINELLLSSGFDPEVGILSIDIDGNDYWVWEAITVVKPKLIICEYNSLFGFEDAITIPLDPNFIRGQGKPFSFYGTSLAAAASIAKKQGYFFIGCNRAGNNAYFLSEEFRSISPVAEKTVRDGYNLSQFSESWNSQREPLRGADKIRTLEGQKVINIISRSEVIFNAEKIISSLREAGKFRGVEK